MLLPRMIEEKMLLLLRKGEISKWFSGIGQEAISVGATLAMAEDEYILPLHRNLGVFTSRIPELERLFGQWMGKKEGFTKGRDRSFHFGTNDHHISGMISHLGAQLSVGAGIALGYKWRKEQKCVLAFTGDGGTSEGEFHEALNVASVWNLPIIFLIENNGYGLSTPTKEQYACEDLVDKAIGYGMEGIQIDGNNVVEVFQKVSEKAEEIRKDPKPVLIECLTFRRRGHEEASGVKYVPPELIAAWEKKDPISNYYDFLLREKLWSQQEEAEWRTKYEQLISSKLSEANKLTEPSPRTEEELDDVFVPFSSDHKADISGHKSEKRLIDACRDGLYQAMERWGELHFMGQDVADYGGVFKVSEGFLEKFGAERVRNTPICESTIVGMSLGLSILGIKSVVEMQFSDFVSCAFNQIVNNLAKSHYRWGQNADVVIRMPTGAGVAAGPFHSQSTESWFAHTPGLKIVYPSNPFDAKGLLLASIEDPNPVLFYEHKALYRSVKEEIPDEYYTLPIGKAKRVKEGNSISVITYGAGVHWMLEYMAAHPDCDIELIDLRSLVPWDKESVAQSVKKIGKVLVLHEDSQSFGIGAELASWIGENLFEYLDGPVIRVGSMDSPIPFHKDLEDQYLAKSRLSKAIDDLNKF